MNVTTAELLVSERGTAAIEEAAGMLDSRLPSVTAISRLRSQFSQDDAAAIWSAAESRQKSAKKFGDLADRLVLDRDGAEMASGAVASDYHATLLAESGCTSVVDICAGLGLDSFAFARHGMSVNALEVDEGRARLLSENAARLGLSHLISVKCCNSEQAELPDADCAYFDPARRSGERKWVRSAEDTSPPLSFIARLTERYPSILAKLSPAIDRNIASTYDGSLQFVSIDGECKEGLLSCGRLKSEHELSAILLPARVQLFGRPTSAVHSHPGSYLWEPDPAVIRSGLTGLLADSLSGWQCDLHNDYFFTDQAAESPFALCYRVKSTLLYSRRALQDALKGVGRVILKQRGFPQPIEDVRSRLSLKGHMEEIVVLAGFHSEKYVFIVEKTDPSRSEPPIV